MCPSTTHRVWFIILGLVLLLISMRAMQQRKRAQAQMMAEQQLQQQQQQGMVTLRMHRVHALEMTSHSIIPPIIITVIIAPQHNLHRSIPARVSPRRTSTLSHRYGQQRHAPIQSLSTIRHPPTPLWWRSPQPGRHLWRTNGTASATVYHRRGGGRVRWEQQHTHHTDSDGDTSCGGGWWVFCNHTAGRRYYRGYRTGRRDDTESRPSWYVVVQCVLMYSVY